MVINTNISAHISAQLLSESSTRLSKSLARLSSGSKITSPEDDAAGLAVSLRFDAQVNRISAAANNVGNAISYGQTQDGFLKNVGKALDRMSELAVLALDITKTDPDRALYNSEFQTLGQYISEISKKDFNGVSLFDGLTRNVTTDGEGSTSSNFAMTGINLGLGAYASAIAANVSNTTTATAALSAVKTAISQLSSDRGTNGSSLARLQYTNGQLVVLKANLSASSSRLKDVDVAEESTQYARYNVLVQSGTAMLAQANTAPQSVLRLLG
jgi:flagellin